MKPLGLLLLIGGILFGVFALNMDTSVEVNYPMGNLLKLPERVNNLGLMSDKQNYLIFSGIISILGALMFFSSKPVSKKFPSHKTTEVNYKNPIINTNDNSKIETKNLIAQLSQLLELKEKNVITEGIYEQERQSILIKLQPNILKREEPSNYAITLISTEDPIATKNNIQFQQEAIQKNGLKKQRIRMIILVSAIIAAIVLIVIVLKFQKTPKEIRSDLYIMNLKGNVKKLQTFCYEAKMKSSEIIKGSRIVSYDHGLADGLEEYDNDVINFNEKGDFTEKFLYLGNYIYKYDKEGKKLEEINLDSRGKTESKTTYQYDESNNLKQENYYDSDGQLNSKVIFQSDKKQNVILETRFAGDSIDMKTVNKYDNQDNKIEKKLFDKSGINYRTFSYEYDKRNNLLKENIDDWHKTTLYEYDDNNNKVKMIEIDDSGTHTFKSTTTYKYNYDQMGNMTRKIYYVDSEPTYFVDFRIEYYTKPK